MDGPISACLSGSNLGRVIVVLGAVPVGRMMEDDRQNLSQQKMVKGDRKEDAKKGKKPRKDKSDKGESSPGTPTKDERHGVVSDRNIFEHMEGASQKDPVHPADGPEIDEPPQLDPVPPPTQRPEMDIPASQRYGAFKRGPTLQLCRPSVYQKTSG